MRLKAEGGFDATRRIWGYFLRRVLCYAYAVALDDGRS